MQSLSEDYIYKLKILIFGPKSGGKSTLLYTYLNNRPPSSHLPNEDLNFNIKKQECPLNNKIYECRMHMWQVATRIINNKSIKNDLFNRVAAYVFIYRDEKGLNQLKNAIWPQLDFKRITNQPVYIILNDSGKQRHKKVVQDFSEMLPNNKDMIFLSQFNLQNPSQVQLFFQQMAEKLLEVCANLNSENWVLRDRSNKVVLRDHGSKEHMMEKRYNKCC